MFLQKSSQIKLTLGCKESINDSNMSDTFLRGIEFVGTVWPCLERKSAREFAVSFQSRQETLKITTWWGSHSDGSSMASFKVVCLGENKDRSPVHQEQRNLRVSVGELKQLSYSSRMSFVVQLTKATQACHRCR